VTELAAAACSAPTRDYRTFALAAAVVFLNAFGNLSLAWGMRHTDAIVGLNPLDYVRAMLNPFVAAGIVLLVLWLLTRMALLSWADLSFVVPITSVGYVLSAILGVWFMAEVVTPVHWMGTALIFAGTLLVGSTRPDTASRA
jgi:uncharacterized membrane protein